MRATFNYPFVRIASGRVRMIEHAPASHPPETFERMVADGWHHSAWMRRNIIHSGDDKVHFDTRFARYREDGSVIGEYDSIYVVNKQDGHWGVQARCSFAPMNRQHTRRTDSRDGHSKTQRRTTDDRRRD